MLVGYMRASTHEQTTNLQMDALIKAGVTPDWIYSDRFWHQEGPSRLERLQQGLAVW